MADWPVAGPAILEVGVNAIVCVRDGFLGGVVAGLGRAIRAGPRWERRGTLVDALYWGGLALLALALIGFGTALVSKGAVWLRVIVGIAFPALVWSVVEVLRTGDEALVDGAFGAVAAELLAAIDVPRCLPHVRLGQPERREVDALPWLRGRRGSEPPAPLQAALAEPAVAVVDQHTSKVPVGMRHKHGWFCH